LTKEAKTMAKKQAVKTKKGWKGRQPRKADVVVPEDERVADGIVRNLRRVHRRNV
jgi:hypothetical protein